MHCSKSKNPVNLLASCDGRILANGLQWLNAPPEWEFTEEGLTIVPNASSDFFRPYDRPPKDNCCLLYAEVRGDFTAVAQVTAQLVAFGDAAALTVRSKETQWAKLCLERSPIGEVSIVSVVTDPWSDDCNSELVTSCDSYLRLTRKGDLFGMHYSLDGAKWRFVRAFVLEIPRRAMVGIHAQAPFSAGCRVLFRSLTIAPEPIADFRSGV